MKRFFLCVIVASAALSAGAQSVWYQGDITAGYAYNVGKMRIVELGGADGKVKSKAKTDLSRPFISTIHSIRSQFYTDDMLIIMCNGVGASVQYAYGKLSSSNSYGEGLNNWNTLIVPVFYNGKQYRYTNRYTSIYTSLSLGYNFIASSEFEKEYLKPENGKLNGGFYLDCGLGMSYKALDLSLGYQLENFRILFNNDKSTQTKLRTHALFLKIGVKF